MAIFKIFRAEQWAALQQAGEFAGSADDVRDGYIHLSTAEQVAGTLAKHFAGVSGVVIAEVAVDADPALRWEESRGGALFPHLYRPLRAADVVGMREEAGPRP